jgi:hypothetical protein
VQAWSAWPAQAAAGSCRRRSGLTGSSCSGFRRRGSPAEAGTSRRRGAVEADEVDVDERRGREGVRSPELPAWLGWLLRLEHLNDPIRESRKLRPEIESIVPFEVSSDLVLLRVTRAGAPPLSRCARRPALSSHAAGETRGRAGGTRLTQSLTAPRPLAPPRRARPAGEALCARRLLRASDLSSEGGGRSAVSAGAGPRDGRASVVRSSSPAALSRRTLPAAPAPDRG